MPLSLLGDGGGACAGLADVRSAFGALVAGAWALGRGDRRRGRRRASRRCSSPRAATSGARPRSAPSICRFSRSSCGRCSRPHGAVRPARCRSRCSSRRGCCDRRRGGSRWRRCAWAAIARRDAPLGRLAVLAVAAPVLWLLSDLAGDRRPAALAARHARPGRGARAPARHQHGARDARRRPARPDRHAPAARRRGGRRRRGRVPAGRAGGGRWPVRSCSASPVFVVIGAAGLPGAVPLPARLRRRCCSCSPAAGSARPCVRGAAPAGRAAGSPSLLAASVPATARDLTPRARLHRAARGGARRPAGGDVRADFRSAAAALRAGRRARFPRPAVRAARAGRRRVRVGNLRTASAACCSRTPTRRASSSSTWARAARRAARPRPLDAQRLAANRSWRRLSGLLKRGDRAADVGRARASTRRSRARASGLHLRLLPALGSRPRERDRALVVARHQSRGTPASAAARRRAPSGVTSSAACSADTPRSASASRLRTRS